MEKEIKKRGRPKKEEVAQDPIKKIEEQESIIREQLKKITELEQPKIDYVDIRTIPLADEDEYPNANKGEGLERKVLPPLPKSKDDDSFKNKIFKKKSKLNKENMVAVFYLNGNEANLHYIPTEDDGSFKIGKNQYHVNEHCLYTIKIKKDRYPICILPSWTMIPIGTQAWFELSQERRGHELERIIIQAIKKEELVRVEDDKKKKGLSGKMIWIIIGLVIAGYVFLKSKGG